MEGPPLLDAPLREPARAESAVEVHVDAEAQPKRLKLGFDLLKKAGYSGVGGLGKRESGIAEPVSVVVAPEAVGLGYVEGQLEEEEEEEVEAPVESDWVVVRVVPGSVTDAELIALASQWGGAQRMRRRREGTVAMQLSSPARASEMATHFKRVGLRLSGTEVSCFVASPDLVLDDERGRESAVVPVPAKGPPVTSSTLVSPIAPSPAAATTAREPDALSLLLQKIGAPIALPPMPTKSSDFSYDDEDRDGEVAARPAELKPVAQSTTASFLQQIRSKPIESPKLGDAKDLLSSLNSLRHLLSTVAATKQSPKEAEEPARSPPLLPRSEQCRAVNDFEALEDTQVSMKKGDVIILRFCDEESGWSEVEVRGRVGWVPTSHFEPL